VRARLVDLAQETHYPAGSTLLQEGAPVDALGIVVEGRVAIRLHVPGRGTQTILTVEPGDLIGWSAVVRPHRSTSTVVALEPATIVSFSGPALREALEADPELAAAVLSRVLQAVGRRLTATRTQLLDLFSRTSGEPW
jgi:CRP-like cAMP-binding protein